MATKTDITPAASAKATKATTAKAKTKATKATSEAKSLKNFSTWTPEEKAAWASQQSSSGQASASGISLPDEVVEHSTELEDLFPDEMDVTQTMNESDEIDEMDELDEGFEQATVKAAEMDLAQTQALLEALDSLKTVQGIISLSRVTTVSAEGWKCYHRELLDVESDREVLTTATSVSPEIGLLFNQILADLIELAGLEPVLWSTAEITKVTFPAVKAGKVTDLVISGVNPGVYNRQAITTRVILTEAPPATQSRIKSLDLAITIWLEHRLLEAKNAPLQKSLFDLEKPTQIEDEEDEDGFD